MSDVQPRPRGDEEVKNTLNAISREKFHGHILVGARNTFGILQNNGMEFLV